LSWLDRAEMLIGKNSIEKLAASHVVVFGLGGVGSFCAEALIRSGVGHLTIVDGDTYDETNLNRQLGAERDTIGISKAEIVHQHLLKINPECRVDVFNEFYRQGDFDHFVSKKGDFVADCIDDVDAKVDVMKECFKRNIPIISAMGTGNKLDLTKLKVVDIADTHGCPLARSVRQKLRKAGIERGIKVVYSEEAPLLKSATPASMIFVPAAAGLLMAREIVRCQVSGVRCQD